MRFYPRRMDQVDTGRPEAALRTLTEYVRGMQQAGEVMATILNKRFDATNKQIAAMEARIAALEEQQNEGGNG